MVVEALLMLVMVVVVEVSDCVVTTVTDRKLEAKSWNWSPVIVIKYSPDIAVGLIVNEPEALPPEIAQVGPVPNRLGPGPVAVNVHDVSLGLNPLPVADTASPGLPILGATVNWAVGVPIVAKLEAENGPGAAPLSVTVTS